MQCSGHCLFHKDGTMNWYEISRDTLILLMVLSAGIMDFFKGKVPNEIVFPCILFIALLRIVEGGGLGLFHSIKNGILVAFPFFLLFQMSVFGGGDVKLAFLIGMWMGIFPALWVIFYALVFGVAMGVVEMLARGEFFERMKNLFYRKMQRMERLYVPFGGALSVACLYKVIVHYLWGAG